MDDRSTPDEFEVYIGGFASRSYGLWWDGNRLVYESFRDGYEDREQSHVTPSGAQWARFWSSMDELGVWGWDDRYEGARGVPTDEIRDGMHWSLSIRLGDRRVASAGDNSGPTGSNHDESRAFAEFAEAVSRLTGGYAFA